MILCDALPAGDFVKNFDAVNNLQLSDMHISPAVKCQEIK